MSEQVVTRNYKLIYPYPVFIRIDIFGHTIVTKIPTRGKGEVWGMSTLMLHHYLAAGGQV